MDLGVNMHTSFMTLAVSFYDSPFSDEYASLFSEEKSAALEIQLEGNPASHICALASKVRCRPDVNANARWCCGV